MNPTTKTVYGICNAGSDKELLDEIAMQIGALENQYTTVNIISISHCVEKAPDTPQWTALITALVQSFELLES